MTCVPTPGSNRPVAEGSSVCGRNSKCLRSCRRKTPKTLEYIPLIKWILISRLMFKGESPGKRHTLRSNTPRHTCSKTLVKELDKKGAEKGFRWRLKIFSMFASPHPHLIDSDREQGLPGCGSSTGHPVSSTSCNNHWIIIIATMLSEMEVASQTKQ